MSKVVSYISLLAVLEILSQKHIKEKKIEILSFPAENYNVQREIHQTKTFNSERQQVYFTLIVEKYL